MTRTDLVPALMKMVCQKATHRANRGWDRRTSFRRPEKTTPPRRCCLRETRRPQGVSLQSTAAWASGNFSRGKAGDEPSDWTPLTIRSFRLSLFPEREHALTVMCHLAVPSREWVPRAIEKKLRMTHRSLPLASDQLVAKCMS